MDFNALQNEDVEMPYHPDDEAGETALPASIEAQLMRISGVAGVALEAPHGRPQRIVVYLETPAAARKLPSEIDGIEIRTEVTGPIHLR